MAKSNILSGRFTSKLALIIIPTMIVLFHFLITEMIIGYLRESSTPETITQNLQFATSLVNAFTFFQIAAIIFMFIVYPLLSNWRLYRQHDFQGLVYEFNFIKKVVIISFFILLALTFVRFGSEYIVRPIFMVNDSTVLEDNTTESMVNDSTVLEDNTTESMVNELEVDETTMFFECVGMDILINLIPAGQLLCSVVNTVIFAPGSVESAMFYSTNGWVLLVFYSGLFKIISLVLRKDFKFYLAKGYVNSGIRKTSDVEKMRYGGLCLKNYDAYLRKRLDLSIKDLPHIFANMFGSEQGLQKTMDSLSHSFKEEKLGPLRYLLTISPQQKIDEILTGEIVKPIIEIVKEYGIWFATMIPVILLLVQFILRPTQ